MRFSGFGVFIFLLFFSAPGWAQQTPAPQPSSQPASDPQAVAVVQAAITALGGATLIGQAQSWTFQAQTQGPHSNGDVSYTMSTDANTGNYRRADGSMKPAPLIHSHFVPALVGSILLKESQDPEFSILYGGTSTVDSKPATTVIFAFGPQKLPAQIWTFDAASLPTMVQFRLPAEIGARASFPVMVLLSNYQPVSGVLYPFQIISMLPGRPPQIVTLQSIAAGATASANDFNGPGGDLR